MKYLVAVYRVPDSAEYYHTQSMKYRLKIEGKMVEANQQTELHEFKDEEELASFVKKNIEDVNPK